MSAFGDGIPPLGRSFTTCSGVPSRFGPAQVKLDHARHLRHVFVGLSTYLVLCIVPSCGLRTLRPILPVFVAASRLAEIRNLRRAWGSSGQRVSQEELSS